VTTDICYITEALGLLAAQTNAPTRAARLLGAGDALREAKGTPLSPGYQADYAPQIQSARTQLGAAAFAVSWAEGRAMTIQQTVEYALSASDTTSESPQPAKPSAPDSLTSRELQVLLLIADGLSNREIAAQLVLSLGTVKWYTTSIYSKLRVQNRTQAAALAKQKNLL
jgi:ATP/maltotriose-dependent transcriptional regulator MalT